MRNLVLVVAACLLTTSVPAAAPGASALGDIMPVMCPVLFRQLSADPKMFAALENGSMDPIPVCGCAQARFMEDPQIDRLAMLDPAELDLRASPREVVRSYVALRAVGAVMRCMADDLDSQLAEVRISINEGAAPATAAPQN